MSAGDVVSGQAGPRWAAANEVEKLLAAAVVKGDLDLYVEVLINAPLYLPGLAEPDRLLYADHEGVRHLIVFTSVEELYRTAGDVVVGWRGTTLVDLIESWPDPDWGLAVNPAALVGTYISAEQLRVLPLPAESPLSPRDDTERLLYDALLADDLVAVLHVLVAAQVDVALVGTDRRWLVEDLDGVSTVTVFTGGRHPGPAAVAEDFVTVLQRWPSEADQLAVDPGTVLSLKFPRERLDDILRFAEARRAAQAAAPRSEATGVVSDPPRDDRHGSTER